VKRNRHWPLAGLVMLLLAGCATKTPEQPRIAPSAPGISGTISYQDAITLPAGSRIHISLLDAAAGAETRPIAISEQPAAGLPPFAFFLPVQESAITGAGRPLLFVQVIVAGRSWFSNATTPLAVDVGLMTAPVAVDLRNDMRPL
jgi:uncharacterized lipoprotein YbaY